MEKAGQNVIFQLCQLLTVQLSMPLNLSGALFGGLGGQKVGVAVSGFFSPSRFYFLEQL